MLLKRLVLTLLLDEGFLVNSNRFRLQRVANVETTIQYLNFEAIDELVVLDVSRRERDPARFERALIDLTREGFVPIAAGGGVRALADFERLLRAGADKIVLNSGALDRQDLIDEAARVYGSQCVVVSIDVDGQPGGPRRVVGQQGAQPTELDPVAWARQVVDRGAGEIYLTSIDRDGGGRGYDLELVRQVSEAVDVPVIASGGVGEYHHLAEGVREGRASAVSLANLFHFLGFEGLHKARDHLRSEGVALGEALWAFEG